MKVSIPKAKVDEFMIEVGQEVTTYEAYTGNSFSVSFGETVNSGSFDAVTGKLTATDPAKIIDLQPVRVQTLIGTNTVWTDTGGTNTVKYKT
jgi:hypothetical protein